VHGSGVGGSGKLAWTPIIDALGQRIRGIAPDLLWSGWSDIPRMEYSLQAQVDQLVGLLDVLGIARCALVGQSMGAYIAARLACDYPDRVSRLLLVASNTVSKAMGLDLGTMSPGRRAKAEFDGTRAALRRQLKTVLFDDSIVQEMEIDEREAIAQRPGMAEARASLASYVSRLDSDSNLEQWFRLTGRLDKLRLPMALVWGVQDQFAPVELGRQLRTRLPLTAYHEVDQASHWVFRDQVDRFAALLISFLAT